MADEKCKTPGAFYIFQHGGDSIAFAFKAPFDLEINEDEALELEEKIHDFVEELMEAKFKDLDEDKSQENEANTSTVQPYYKDKNGKAVTPASMVSKWKPTGKLKGGKSIKLKGKSESDLVRNWRPKGK